MPLWKRRGALSTPAKPSRIVLTIAVGKEKHRQAALGLGRSLRLIGDSTRRVVITDQPELNWSPAFDEVIRWDGEVKWIFFEKLSGLRLTDADQILFLDADMIAFKRLDPIFEAAAGGGLGVQGKWVNSGEWYGDITEHCKRHSIDALPQFNGGMIYYERTPDCATFINTVWEYGRRSVELGFARDDVLIPDEPCIALAMAKTGGGQVFPDTANYQSSATGLIGQLRMDVRKNECKFLARTFDVKFVEPFIFHASRYMNFRIYWRQLQWLEDLERYENRRKFGYMPPWHKFQRSIERRWLVLRGKL